MLRWCSAVWSITESLLPFIPLPFVNETTQENEDALIISLKNPWVAGLLAWLIPGLGHYYQGRMFKAVLFAVCIIPTFLFGMCLGSSKEIGFARTVYCSWREGDKRLFFIPQFCVGSVALPAIAQAYLVGDGKIPFWNGAMSPPYLPSYPKNRHMQGKSPSLDEIIANLGVRFELGTIFTVVAGLMNLLVIFDAIDGPILFRKEEVEETPKEENQDATEPVS